MTVAAIAHEYRLGPVSPNDPRWHTPLPNASNTRMSYELERLALMVDFLEVATGLDPTEKRIQAMLRPRYARTPPQP